MSDWQKVDDSIPSPNFIEYGFHTGRKVDFRTSDGVDFTGWYEGYGLFCSDTDTNRRDIEATYWRPHNSGASNE